MATGGSKPKTPDYGALAQQQAGINQAAVNYQTMTNRPTQNSIFGSMQWTQDPKTGAWTQNELLDPRVAGLINTSLGSANQQAASNARLAQNPAYKTQPGAALFNATDPGVKAYLEQNPNIAAYDPASGEAFSKQFAQSLLARVTPQQAEDKRQMELKLRLQGLEPGSEAYNRAYQNLLTSQGDVQAQAQLQGMLAGGQESRDIYNTRLAAAMQLAQNRRNEYDTRYQSAMGLQGNARENYQARMEGQNQMNSQAMQAYLLPYQTAQYNQNLNTNQFAQYLPKFESFGTAQGAPGAQIMDAKQQQFAQQMAGYNADQQRNAGYAQAVASYFSDADLKDNIRPMNDADAYAVMCLIKPHTFNWPSGKVAAGLIAQDVQKHLPDLVHEAEGGYLMVNYEAFTALLLGAFRHLAKESGNAHLH